MQGFFLQLFDEKGMLMPGVEVREMAPFLLSAEYGLARAFLSEFSVSIWPRWQFTFLSDIQGGKTWMTGCFGEDFSYCKRWSFIGSPPANGALNFTLPGLPGSCCA